jgi:hypothetical protein
MPTYPLTMPSTPAFKNSEFALSRKVSVAESQFTGAQQVYEYDYALWGGTVTLPPMKRAQAAEWVAFLLKLHGRKGTFYLGDPDSKEPRGDATGIITINGAHSAGATTISVDTSQNSTADLFKVGDYIQIGTGLSSKLHMVVDDSADSDSSGVVSLNIEPQLKAALSGGETVTVSEPVGVMRLATNEARWSADHVSKYGISFAFQEAL